VAPQGGAGDAIVQSWQGVDLADGRPSSVAFAFGFDQSSSQHQVGVDGTDPLAPPLSSVDAALTDGYSEMSAAPHQLSGSDAAVGQVTGTLVTPVHLQDGSGSVRLIIGAGHDPAQALAALQRGRGRTWSKELDAVDRYWQRWLSTTPLPEVPSTSPQYPEAARIDSVAQRALISIRLAVDPDSGAIVASADTQGPYGEDWIRDGSFIDAALDEAGHHGLVTAHALFEAAAQRSPSNLDPAAPPGNWPMNVYGDGLPGGPIPYEIDETGFGAWTLYQHSAYLSGSGATRYLEEVFPAIARAADWLTACQDPVDDLQCRASEDDNLTPSQTLHGAGPDLLGLRSAVSAAQALVAAEPADPQAPLWRAEEATWKARATQLESAIDKLDDADGTGDGLYAESSPAEAALTGASTVPSPSQVYADGGWLLWPVELHPASDPRMQREAAAVLADAMASLEDTTPGYTGSYEAKGLLGVCQALSSLPGGIPAGDLATIRQGVAMLAASSSVPGTRGFTTSTGLFAEAWRNEEVDGATEVVPLNDEPHVWEGALYYMTALCAFPPAT
jgi:GH15 family glucan-1,4-alpha-glucosidase